MPDPGVGFQYPARDASWVKRDVLLFAASIGCTAEELHFLYELHPNFQVFPTYPIVIAFKGAAQDVIDFYKAQNATPIPGVPKFDARRVVDGQRKMEFLKPLPTSSAGKKFQLQTTVLGVYDKGKPGTVVETQTDLVADGEVYNRVTGSAFYVGQGNWGGPKGPSTVNFPPPENKQPDAVHTMDLSNEAALLYRLNGDYNPLHADPAPGKKMGFGGVIMHGLYSWNSACHALLQELGGSDAANIKDFQARFAAPVRPGERLVTEMWRTGEKEGQWEEVRFVTKIGSQQGKPCLSNGRAKMRIAERKSKL